MDSAAPRSVEAWNKVPCQELCDRVLPNYGLHNSDYLMTIKPGTGSARSRTVHQDRYVACLEDQSTINNDDFERCFDLVETTSAAAYKGSSKGWSGIKKRKEMRLLDMKFLLLKPVYETTDTGSVEGFLSFMITIEDERDVVYIYELHLQEDLQGKGAGKWMMSHVEAIGRRAGMCKTMLTVFRSNVRAVNFYEALGYEVDEYSPEPKKLRSGKIKEADYLILSKELGNMNDGSTR